METTNKADQTTAWFVTAIRLSFSKANNMLQKAIFGIGLFLLTAIPLAAQTSQLEKDHPLEAPTPENPKYREQHATKDYTGISKDPKFPVHHAKPVHVAPKAPDTLATSPADDKKKPKNWAFSLLNIPNILRAFFLWRMERIAFLQQWISGYISLRFNPYFCTH